MSDNHNFLALDWVKSEIEETLKQAQQALEAYIANPYDVAKLRFCLAYLHQIFGTLQMVEFYGAAMLAEEMEKLCLSLVNHKVVDSTQAHHALIDAMLQLPAYLERLQVAKRDTPFVLLSTINALRVAHDEAPLSELALFKPDFVRVFSVLGQSGVAPFPAALKKIRHGYQLSLLGIIRQQHLQQNYEHLLLVFEKLGLFIGQKALQALWQMSSALVEGLMTNGIPLTPSIKTLLGEIEQELRKFSAYPQHTPPLDLLKNILYYLAKSRGMTHRIIAIRALYRLDEALPTFDVVEAEKEKLAAPDRQAMQSVIKGVSDELAHVKETIDDLTYASHPDIQALKPLLPILKQVASTLQVLGFQQLQKIISEQNRTLSKAINFGVLPEGALLVIASGLIEVESSLQQVIDDQPLSSSIDTFGGNAMVDQVSAAQGAVLRESRTALEKAKECIVEYISSQWNAERLAELPALLATVRGGLTMLDLTRPAHILSKLSEFIQQHLLKDEYRPSWSEMDTLADVISSVEYYLERVANHHQNNSLLDLASQSLDKLGYGLVLVPPPEPVVRRTEAKTEEEKALPEVIFEVPESLLEKTLFNTPAIVLPEPVDIEATAQEADWDKTQVSMPALVLPEPKDDLREDDVDALDETQTFVAQPSLASNASITAQVNADDKTLLHLPVAVLPEPKDVIDEDDSVFNSTLTFDAEAILGNMTFTSKKSIDDAPLPESSTPHLTQFDGTESAFMPSSISDPDATLVNIAISQQLATLEVKDTAALIAIDNNATVQSIGDIASAFDETMVGTNVIAESAAIISEEKAIDASVVKARSNQPPFEVIAEVPQDDSIEDEEIREIFVEEAEEVLETLQEFLPKWAANFENKTALTEVRRGFHTLKGSGRMVGAKVVAELAWSIENMLNRVIDKSTQPNAVMMGLITEVVAVTPDLVANFHHQQSPCINTAALMTVADLFAKAQSPSMEDVAWAMAYARGETQAFVEDVQAVEANPTEETSDEMTRTAVVDIDLTGVFNVVFADIIESPSVQVVDDAPVTEENRDLTDEAVVFDSDLMDEVFDVPMDLGAESTLDSQAEKFAKEETKAPVVVIPQADAVAAVPELSIVTVPQHILVPTDDFSQDDEIREIFIEEVEEVLETINTYFPKWAANFTNSSALTEFRRGFHTLKGSGRMVGAKVEAELAWSVENMLNRVIDKTAKPSPEMTRLITEVIQVIPELVSNFQNKETPTLNTSPLMSIADHFAHAKEVSIAEIEAAVACMHGKEPEPVIAQKTTVDDIKDEIVAVAVSTTVTAEESTDEADMTDAFEELAASLAEMPAQSESMVTQDTVLLDIFTNEANSYLDEIATYLAELPAQYKAVAVTDQMLRALHTLRGSAGMAGIKAIALIAAPMEQLLKDLRNQHRGLQHKHIELLAESHRLIKQSIVDVMAGGEGFIPEVNDFVARVESTAHAPVSSDDENVVAEAASPVNAAGLVAGFLDLGLDHLLDAPWELSGWLSAPDHAEHIQLLLQELERLAPSAKASMVLPLAEMSNQLICVYRFIAEDAEKALANGQLLEDLANAHDEIINIFDTLAASQTVNPNPKLVERLREWGGSPVVNLPTESSYVPPVAEIDDGADPELLSIFLEEAEEVLTAADDELNNWRANLEDKLPLRVLQRHLHTLKGGARMAVVASLGDLGHELEFLYEDLVNNRYQATQVLIDLLQRCHDRLAEMIEDLQKEGHCKFAKDLVDVIDLYRHKPSDAVILDFFSPAAGGLTKVENIETVSSVAIPESLATKIEVESTVAATPVISATSAAVEYDSTSQDLDPDLLAIFLEEAQEIVDETNAGLQEWIKQPENVTPVQILQRGLHTLKGGAFMSGVKSLGDLAHEMENIYEGVCLKRYHGTPDVFSLLQRCHDRIADAVVSLQDNGKSLSVGDLVEQLKRYLSNPATFKDEIAVVVATPVTPIAAPSVAQTVTTIEVTEPSLPVIADGMMPAMTGNFRQASSTQAAQEMIRVSSELMEKLINLAGETSITRSRVEMGVHGFAQTVEEMGATVQRLVDQLRRMEGELEVQILASHTEEASKYEDFDPLEMDQYSSLNQLSKSLSESASDLFEIKATLIEKARDTETLLLQQARLNTELQEGLMSSRLVPFSRLAPRLQRIVRQTSTELHKPAELTVINAEGEMDRTLLERIVAPLEHMLRNAVDHGLESPADRAAAGKEAMGRISLTIGREGGEIILTLADDGRGVNVDAVRKKAIERGLLDENTAISEKELLQFLFSAGFSTAQKVTQISGRGVGMDVVQSEIKQLGGTVVIHSVAGKGTTFVMRLPFTVAVSRALMVRIGEDVYAIPLSQIEGIVRASPYELETYYAPDAPPFEYANIGYKLHYLGEFVHGVRVPSLFGQTLPLPIMLVRGAEQRVAIQVDQLIGSREIVVKSVGAQLASVAGISGATILGDGSVVIILDTVAMLRAASLQKPRQKQQIIDGIVAAKPERTTRTVMVVDDSVTVRKVTSRLLERHGFEVVLAKDGLDAITKLEDIRPDIMLLDIEMPRMDGFEVASLVRHNPNLIGLPIIMITSRTGEKHRERAFQIGVNAYMGKPFQEQQLLETISELLAAVAAR